MFASAQSLTQLDPLLDLEGPIRFADIDHAKIHSTMKVIAAQTRATVEKIIDEVAAPESWDFVQRIDDAHAAFDRAFQIVSHLNEVRSTPQVRRAFLKSQELINDYQLWFNQNHELYARFLSLEKRTDLTLEQREALESIIYDFKMGGIELEEGERKIYNKTVHQLASLSAKFNTNLLEATDAFYWRCEDWQRHMGLPEYALAAAKEEASRRGLTGYVFTMQDPSYDAIMQFCDDRNVRRLFYQARMTRATTGKYSNVEIINKILKLRKKLTTTITKDPTRSYADLAASEKMALTPQTISDFLQRMADSAKKGAARDLDRLRELGKLRGFESDLMPWDLEYLTEKFRSSTGLSSVVLNDYLRDIDGVLEGLINLTREMYEIEIIEVTREVQTWHPSVRVFRVGDGLLYVDLYAREKKTGGAWMDEFSRRRVSSSGKIYPPAANLNCNFTPGKMNFEELQTIFHEWGHCVHALSCASSEYETASLGAIEWDIVELPSMLMEFFCWNRNVLDYVASHWKSREKIPQTLYDALIANKHVNTGYQLARMIQRSTLDLEIHRSETSPWEIEAKLIDEYAPYLGDLHDTNLLCGFHHLFAGNMDSYAVGYYGYLWAEMYAANVYAEFERAGLRGAGRRFYNSFLKRGASRPASKSLEEFGCYPATTEKLLRYRGLALEVVE